MAKRVKGIQGIELSTQGAPAWLASNWCEALYGRYAWIPLQFWFTCHLSVAMRYVLLFLQFSMFLMILMRSWILIIKDASGHISWSNSYRPKIRGCLEFIFIAKEGIGKTIYHTSSSLAKRANMLFWRFPGTCLFINGIMKIEQYSRWESWPWAIS